MEAFYSPSTQTLSLLPRSSCSSLSSSSGCISVSRIQSVVRTEFFGSRTKLRVRESKFKRIRLSETTRVVPVAVFTSLPVVAVVVAVTVSAAAVVFSKLNTSKRKVHSDEEPGGSPPTSNEVDVGNTGEHLYTEAVTSQIDDREKLELQYQHQSSKVEDTPDVEKIDIPDSHFDDALSSDLNSQQTIPVLKLEAEVSSRSELLFVAGSDSSPEVDAISEDSEVITLSLPQAFSDLNAHETDETRGVVSEELETAITEEKHHELIKHEHYESETIHHGTTGPSREDIYSFYENAYVLEHGVSDLSTKPSYGNKDFRLTTRNASTTILKKDNSQSAGIAGEGTVASVAVRTFNGKKDLWKKSVSSESDTQDPSFVDVPDMQMMQANGKQTLSPQMISYNRLLKKGRLHECIELLKDMQSNDILDMSKIYHAKFFNICRGQKAVKEAFSFAKLIPNPALSTFNMLMSVCSASQDSEGAFNAMRLVKEAGLKADCKLYTTLISTCAKSGKVDTMFEVFHDMVNKGEEPNVHTYGALIDGCARAGQVAKAFGAYGILRSKNVQPDRVVFNALITACGQSGAVERAFDVLAEMGAELHPIDPDHVTIGALIRACISAGQVERVKEVYRMIDQYNIKGTPELYTIAVNSCSQTGDWEFACNVYDDMKKKGVIPDEMFFSALIHVAGRAGNLDAAFKVLQDARIQGMNPGIVSYSSLMGACSNARSWKRALELFEQIKAMNLNPTVSTLNALLTALCDADQIKKSMNVLSEMKELGLSPNDVTYSILIAASERNDDIEAGLALFYQAKADAVPLSQFMCKCLIKMCSRRFEKASTIGEPVLSFKSGKPQIESKWSSLALMIYRDIIVAGLIPSAEILSQILGCLQLPQDATLKKRLTESLEISAEVSKNANLLPLVDGFAEYDVRAFSLFEEAASLGIVPCVSFKENPIVIDVREFNAHVAKVYILTVLKGLKHRLAAGARLPSVTIILSVGTTKILSSAGEKTINVTGRVSQTVGALLRRLRLPYQGNESHGKIRITGLAVKRWLQPKLIPSLTDNQSDLGLFQFGLTSGISNQQRNIRSGNLSLY